MRSDEIEAAAKRLDRAGTALSNAIVYDEAKIDDARTELYRAQDALRDALALPREAPPASSSEAAREACAKVCLLAADECPGTEDECATWREAAMWCVQAIRALLLPAPDEVERARRAMDRAIVESDRLASSEATRFTEMHRAAVAREWEATTAYRTALLAAERDEKGGDDGR